MLNVDGGIETDLTIVCLNKNYLDTENNNILLSE